MPTPQEIRINHAIDSLRVVIKGVGQNLPVDIVLGRQPLKLRWDWSPQLYIFKVHREQSLLRFSGKRFEASGRASLWSFGLLFRLIRNGINPFSGLLSGRQAKLILPVGCGSPSFIGCEQGLLSMRSAGKMGLLLNDYSTFLEVQLMRKQVYPVITDFSIQYVQQDLTNGFYSTNSFLKLIYQSLVFIRNLMPARNSLENLPDWYIRKATLTFDKAATTSTLVSGKSKLFSSPTSSKQVIQFEINEVTIHNGRNIVSKEGILLNNQSELSPELLKRSWPRYFWGVSGSVDLQMPGSILLGTSKSATYVSAVNNLYHFLEDTFPQIELNNQSQTPNPLIVGGNLDPVLRILAEAASATPVTFLRDEERIEVESLKFFQISDFRKRLSAGEVIDIDSHASLIQFAVNRVLTPYMTSASLSMKIFVVRRKGLQRRLINATNLIKTLTNLGFTMIYFEELSFEERCRILSRTSILIGESGAGLANGYFMHPNTKIVEIRHPRMKGSLEHTIIEKAVGLNYSIVNGLEISKIQKLIFGTDAFKVNINQVVKCLR